MSTIFQDQDIDIAKIVAQKKDGSGSSTFYLGLDYWGSGLLYTSSPVVYPVLAEAPTNKRSCGTNMAVRHNITLKVFAHTPLSSVNNTFADMLATHDFHGAAVTLYYYPKTEDGLATDAAANVRQTLEVVSTDHLVDDNIISIVCRDTWFEDKDFGHRLTDADFGTGVTNYSDQWVGEIAPFIFGDSEDGTTGVIASSCPLYDNQLVSDGSGNTYQRVYVMACVADDETGILKRQIYVRNPFQDLDIRQWLPLSTLNNTYAFKAPLAGPTTLVAGSDFSMRQWRFATKYAPGTTARMIGGCTVRHKCAGTITAGSGQLMVTVKKAVNITGSQWATVGNVLAQATIDATVLTASGVNYNYYFEKPLVLPPNNTYFFICEWTNTTDDSTYATGTFTNDGTNFSNGDTVTIDSKTYTFQSVLTNVDGNVKIGASNTASVTNLYHAINALGGAAGTDYAASTVAHTSVTATNPTSTTVLVTTRVTGSAGNSIASTDTAAHGSWGGSTLSGGTPGNYPIIKYDGTDTSDHCFTNDQTVNRDGWTDTAARFQLQVWDFGAEGAVTGTPIGDYYIYTQRLDNLMPGVNPHTFDGPEFKIGLGVTDANGTYEASPGDTLQNPAALVHFLCKNPVFGMDLSSSRADYTTMGTVRGTIATGLSLGFSVEQSITCGDLIESICHQSRLRFYKTRAGKVTLNFPTPLTGTFAADLTEAAYQADLRVLSIGESDESQLINRVDVVYNVDVLTLNQDPALARRVKDSRFLGLEYSYPGETGTISDDSTRGDLMSDSLALYGERSALWRFELHQRGAGVRKVLNYYTDRYGFVRLQSAVRVLRKQWYNTLDLFSQVRVRHSMIPTTFGNRSEEPGKLHDGAGTEVKAYNEGVLTKILITGEIKGEILEITEQGPYMTILVETMHSFESYV